MSPPVPAAMRAVQFDRYGGSEVLEVRTVPVFTIDDAGFEVELVVLALDDLRTPVRTTPEGKPLERARLQAVQALLDNPV